MAKLQFDALNNLKASFTGHIFDDLLTRSVYANDASVYEQIPYAVAYPKTDADIESLIQFANQSGIGLIPRTAGTSLAGQVVGDGMVVDVSRHFTNIIEVNTEEKWVRVQPGVIRDELNMALKSHGLFFGPETSTSNRAMLGGMLGNNSCGSNSIVYGSTRDQTLEVTGFLSDGSRVCFGPLDSRKFESVAKHHQHDDDSLETKIYRGLFAMLNDAENQAEIKREFADPAIDRRNTGYAIDALLDCEVFSQSTAPFNLCKLIAGSEGTLFLATEIKLRLHPLPPPIGRLLCGHFESVSQALQATRIAMKYRPSACELIDHFILDGAARNAQQKLNAGFVEGSPAAILIVELRGSIHDEVVASSDQMVQEMREANLGYAWPVIVGDEMSNVWELRKSGLGVINNVPGNAKPTTLIEDAAVALDDLPRYIEECDELLLSKYGVECVHYGHAGAGEIHLRPVLDLKTSAGQQQFKSIATDVAKLVKKYRGSLSGEHGDGRVRGPFLEQMIGSHNYELMRQVKQLWDPSGIFNPGKIIDTPPINSDMRYQPAHTGRKFNTVFNFDDTQGMLGAAELCNGSGDCRKTHLTGGTMCPSYMATHNEADTTRARANLLRQVMTGSNAVAENISDEDAVEILDLCLSCKGCKNECPANVDMAKLKSEFMRSYYDRTGIPRQAKMVANMSRYSKLASYLPRFANWLASNSWTGNLIKHHAGFSLQRSLPRLSRITLRSWFKRHLPHKNAGSRGELNLFCDEFTNFFDVDLGIATVELLEQLGWKVDLPKHAESGRAAISKGMLIRARDIAKQNVNSLGPLVRADKPLVGIEPSALLTFRDEYPDLLRGDQSSIAKRLAQNCFLIDEFLDQAGLDADQFKLESKTIRLHGHCHQKALSSLAPTVRILQLPKNYRVRMIPSGCCGMAGSFGFEKDHYEISMQIGELVLFPTIRDEPVENLIAATGTSCRQQIFDGTGRNSFHPVEILRNALVEEF